MKSGKIKTYLVALAVFEGAGILGSLLTDPGSSWYRSLTKAALNPPSWVFGTTWTVLYALMAASFVLLWDKREEKLAQQLIALFGVHLALNALWSPIFFGLRNPGLALADLAAMLLTLVPLMIYSWRVRRAAALLLLPYLAWLLFATYLNWSIVTLN